jgi:hypothetical protein
MIEQGVPRKGRRAGARAAQVGVIAAGALVGLLVTASRGIAQDGRSDGKSSSDVRDCINTHLIDHTEVVDDNTILFVAKTGDSYRNDLPNRCPELRSEQRFMYRVTTSQLCSTDTITVLNQDGFGFTPGPTCGLGKFAPITADEAADLEQKAHDRSRLFDGRDRDAGREGRRTRDGDRSE